MLWHTLSWGNSSDLNIHADKLKPFLCVSTNFVLWNRSQISSACFTEFLPLVLHCNPISNTCCRKNMHVCTSYIVHCTSYIVHYIVRYIVHCTLYTAGHTMSTACPTMYTAGPTFGVWVQLHCKTCTAWSPLRTSAALAGWLSLKEIEENPKLTILFTQMTHFVCKLLSKKLSMCKEN